MMELDFKLYPQHLYPKQQKKMAEKSKLVKTGTLKLEGAGQYPWHTGILCLRDDLLILVDSPAYNIRLYSNQTGKLLAISERLKSQPWSIGMLDKSGSCIAVALWNGTIEILSIQSNETSTSIKSVRSIATQMMKCYAVCSITQGNELVITGPYQGFHCFTVLSSLGDVPGTLCKICTYGGLASYLATSKDELNIYVSCSVCHDSPENGVYCYNLTSGQCKFKYRRNLKLPRGICVDSMGYIYVCDQNTNCIHQVTEDGEPVAVFGELDDIPAEPVAVCFKENCHELFVTSWARNEVSRLKLIHDLNIPAEILRMDAESLQMYKEALQEGMEKVFNIRVMVVGHYGVGKTTLTKRLLGKDVNIVQRKSTEGIDVHTHCCRVSLDTWEWATQHKEAEKYARLQRLIWLLNDPAPKRKVNDGKSGHIDGMYETDTTTVTANIEDSVTDDSDLSTTLKPDIVGSVACNALGPDRNRNYPRDTERKDQIVELIQMVNENVADLKNRTEKKYAGLTMMDFAGQYAFYTTHPIFMTSRAIYILVTDLSQQITDIVTDNECFFDCDGIKLHMVHEFVEVWLNSIHSIAPLNTVGIPPVVLVATHLDKIPEESRQVVVDRYFQQIRSKLKDQPTRLHLAIDDFALDNTRLDPNLEDLKRLITDLARRQPFWGEEVPARWLPLEQSIMALKDSGVKIVLLRLVKELNQSGSVPITSEKELELFLRFQNEKGTILYFRLVKELNQSGSVLTSEKKLELFLRFQHEIGTILYFRLVKELNQSGSVLITSEKELELFLRFQHEIGTIIYFRLVKELNQSGSVLTTSEKELELFVRFQHEIGTILYFRLVKELNQSGSVLITSEKELELFLRFQHEIGTIIYFSANGLKDKIVLDPIWLIDALKSIITAKMFIYRNNPAITGKWDEFEKNGKLTPELVDAVWTKESNSDFHENKEHILPLMEQLNIIAKPRSFNERGDMVKAANYYIVPCMFRQATPEEVISPKVNPQMGSTTVLCYVFTEHFLPSPVFHRLLAACMTQWPVARKESDHLIFCCCSVFDLDHCHRLILHFRNHVIFVRITRMGKRVVIPDLKLCIKVREYIDRTLSHIIGYLFTNIQYHWYIQCPRSEVECIDSMVPVSEMKNNAEFMCKCHADHAIESREVCKFWFETKELHAELEPENPISWYPLDLQDERPSDQNLSRLSLRIGREFHTLGLELGISEAEIQQIQIENPFVATQCFMILFRWAHRNVGQATFRNLERALRKVCADTEILTTLNEADCFMSCLSTDVLDTRPTEQELKKISVYIGKEFIHLGVELGIHLARIEQIRLEYPRSVARQSLEILFVWRANNAPQDTFRNLERAFWGARMDANIINHVLSSRF